MYVNVVYEYWILCIVNGYVLCMDMYCECFEFLVVEPVSHIFCKKIKFEANL